MQLFILHADPILSARAYCDQHIVKIPVEAAQVAVQAIQSRATLLHIPAMELHRDFPRRDEQGNPDPYRASHQHHPLTLWAGCQEAHDELVERAIALCDEYERRYGRVHACREILAWCQAWSWILPSRSGDPLDRFPLPKDPNLHGWDLVDTHRRLYRSKTATIPMRWKEPGERPGWLGATP